MYFVAFISDLTRMDLSPTSSSEDKLSRESGGGNRRFSLRWFFADFQWLGVRRHRTGRYRPRREQRHLVKAVSSSLPVEVCLLVTIANFDQYKQWQID